MNSPNDLSNSEPAASVELAEIAALKSLLQISVLASLIASTAFAVYGYWQFRSVNRDRAMRAAALAELPKAYEQLDTISKSLREYAGEQQQFRVFLEARGIQLFTNTAPAAPRPGASPQR